MTKLRRGHPNLLRLVFVLYLLSRAMPSIGCSSQESESQSQPNSSADADEVEYAVAHGNENIRVLLTVQGAARIDFRTRAESAERIRTVIFPTNAKEVDRLVRAVDGLIGASALSPFSLQWEGDDGSGDTVLGSRRSGRTRSVRTSFAQGYNAVLDGVREEIEVLSLLQLAKAVHAWDEGETLV